MKLKHEYIIYGFLIGIVAVFVYFGREVLPPFILAAIFAYILNPLVDFLANKLRFPRGLSVAIIYLLLIGVISFAAINITMRISEESSELSSEAKVILTQTNNQIAALPSWLQPIARDTFETIRTSVVPNKRISTYIPGALNRTLGVLIFLTTGFYFLKDGKNFKNGFLNLFPGEMRFEAEIVLLKINRILGDYLRGQFLMIIIMSTLFYVGLSVIGVRYSLILAIFSGLTDIIPLIGPFVAGSLAALVAFTDQYSRLGIDPILDMAAVASLYVVLNQIESLFIAPQIMGRMTKLHPLIILFSVLVGGHIFGIPGYLIAVPFTASLKVVFDHVSGLFEKSHKKALESE